MVMNMKAIFAVMNGHKIPLDKSVNNYLLLTVLSETVLKREKKSPTSYVEDHFQIYPDF